MQVIGVVLPSKRMKWRGWNEMKRKVVDYSNVDTLDDDNDEKYDDCDVKADRRVKFRHASAYIRNFVNTLMGDATAVCGLDEKTYIPYRKVIFFYAEYEHYCDTNNIDKSCRAGERTFAYAFAAAKDELHLELQDARGGFDTCEICNNADILLKSRQGWTKDQIRIIQEFRRFHLVTQQRERQLLDTNIELARSSYDETGQPKTVLFFCDGFTEWKGETPRFPGVHSHGAKYKTTHASRIIGVQVVCGPIDEFFVYYVDDLVSKGANIMIEVQRQAILDVAKRLATFKTSTGVCLEIPKHAIFQFDNSRENKNRFMFTYFSLLVEEHHFDRIDINFLIVGHTHGSIDQFFSVLAKAIDRVKFICSPLALVEVIRSAFVNDVKKRSISVIRQIRVVYNYTEALKKVVNRSIKYFVVPHNFQITRKFQRAVMQYKLYSRNATWLPRPPDYVDATMLSRWEILTIEHSLYDSIGGRADFDEYCGMDTNITNTSQSRTKNLRQVLNREAIFNDMASMEATAILEVCNLQLTYM